MEWRIPLLKDALIDWQTLVEVAVASGLGERFSKERK